MSHDPLACSDAPGPHRCSSRSPHCTNRLANPAIGAATAASTMNKSIPNRCEAHRPAPCESPRAGMRAGGRFVEARTTRGTPDGVANHTDERASCSTRPRPHATHLLLSSARVLTPAAQPLTHWPCSTVRLRMFVATPLRGWGFRNPMGGTAGRGVGLAASWFLARMLGELAATERPTGPSGRDGRAWIRQSIFRTMGCWLW